MDVRRPPREPQRPVSSCPPERSIAQPKGEQDATRFLFAGGYGVPRNPAGHREIDYTDTSEAGEGVQAASLLMRVLDRVEDRLFSTVRSVSAIRYTADPLKSGTSRLDTE